MIRDKGERIWNETKVGGLGVKGLSKVHFAESTG